MKANSKNVVGMVLSLLLSFGAAILIDFPIATTSITYLDLWLIFFSLVGFITSVSFLVLANSDEVKRKDPYFDEE